MKKYIKPETTVVVTSMHQMLCLSGIIDKTSGETITQSSDFGTREDNAWDIWGSESAEGCE